MPEDRAQYLKQSSVSRQTYSELKRLWAYFPDAPWWDLDKTDTLKLVIASQLPHVGRYIKTRWDDYLYGVHTGRWRLIDQSGRILMVRFEGGFSTDALTNVRRICVSGSPSGHEWGYGGSGPKDLALDILNQPWVRNLYTRERLIEMWAGKSHPTALELHQDFKRDVIANMGKEGGTLTREFVLDWVQKRMGPCSIESEVVNR